MYLNESDDIMPVAAAMPFEVPSSDPGIAEVLEKQLGDPKIMECPSDVGPDGQPGYYFKREKTSYFYHAMRGGQKVGDDFFTKRWGKPGPIMCDMKPFHGEPGKYGSCNYLFSDGSVGDLIDSEAEEVQNEQTKDNG